MKTTKIQNDAVATVKSENGSLYLFSCSWQDCSTKKGREWIIDQATGFYGVFMVELVEVAKV